MRENVIMISAVDKNGSNYAVFCDDMKYAESRYPDAEKRVVNTDTICDVKNVPLDHKRYIVAYYDGISSLFNNWGYYFVWDYDTLEEAEKNQGVMCSVFDTDKK